MKSKKWNIIFLLVGLFFFLGMMLFQAQQFEKKQLEEGLTITYMHFQAKGDPLFQAQQDAIDEFERDYPNVTIQQIYYPEEAYHDIVSDSGFLAKDVDMLAVNGRSLDSMLQHGVLKNLEVILEDMILYKLSDENIFTELSRNESIYGIPLMEETSGFILYNEEIFQEIGVTEFPDSIEAFNSVCNKLIYAGYIPMVVGSRDLWPLDTLVFHLILGNRMGTEWMEDMIALNNPENFTDQEFIKTLYMLDNLVRKGVFNDDMNTIDLEQSKEAYQNRTAAMLVAREIDCQDIAKFTPEIASCTSVAFWPASVTWSVQKNSIVQSYGQGIGLSSQIEDQKLEYSLIFINQYLCGNAFAQTAMEEGIVTPWGADSIKEQANPLNQKVYELLERTQVNVVPNLDMRLPEEVKGVYQEGLRDLTLGIMTPEELGERLVEKVTEGLS